MNPQLDIFTPPPLIFSHKRENSKANEELYQAHKLRLIRNARIILWCLIEGQYLTGLKIGSGIMNSGMNAPKRIIEYRKRFAEIIHAGINVTVTVMEGGYNQWHIEEHLREIYKEQYKDVPKF